MNENLLNAALIVVFIVIGGVFAAAEMALVSLRDSQVKQLAHRGKRGQTVAKLHDNPNRFLSAVQIGVTLAGFLSAAFGGATLAGSLSPLLQRLLPIGAPVADTAGAGADHRGHQLRLHRARRAGRQAAGAAAGRGVRDGARPVRRLHRHPLPTDHLAAGRLHQRGRPAARRRPATPVGKR